MANKEEKKLHFKVIQFMYEAGTKLSMKSVPMATASLIYHKFFKDSEVIDFDPYLIGMTSLYLAGKVEEDHLRIRDVINVCYRTLHPKNPPLDIGSTYWSLRDSVVQCELFLLRALKFHVNFDHPHKYLLHYLKSLTDWLEPSVVKKVPITKTTWGLLRDSYHSNLCLRYPAQHIAVSMLYMGLQCYGIEVPCDRQASNRWYEALCEDIRVETIHEIITELINTYDMEKTT